MERFRLAIRELEEQAERFERLVGASAIPPLTTEKERELVARISGVIAKLR